MCSIVEYYEYDAWGKIITMDAASSTEYSALSYNPLRYRGYIYDSETGFYYLQSRYYDPSIRRFINADGYVSTGQDFTGYNMFAYCGNNPTNRSDPFGLFWQEIADLVEVLGETMSLLAKSAAISLAANAARCTVSDAITGGGVYRRLPNGLADQLIAQSNTLSTISSSSSFVAKAAGILGTSLVAFDLGKKYTTILTMII